MRKKAIFWLLAILIIIIVGLLLIPRLLPSKLDDFASCLKEKGATYYGAFWCPNCQKQEALFGNAKENLPRVECSTPDGKGQLLVCRDAKITAYPTWEFADGERLTGTQSLKTLAEKTGCVLP